MLEALIRFPAPLWFGTQKDVSDESYPEPRNWRERFMRFHRRNFTWVHFTRLVGIIGIGYEVVVDKIDRPSVMIVLGAMVLGAESVKNIFGKGGPS